MNSGRKRSKVKNRVTNDLETTGVGPAVSAEISLVPPVLIFLLTIVVFLPILQNGFVNWDDESFLVSNLNYRGLGWKEIHWMFTTCYLSSCMPLTWVTYGLDYVLWGMNPLGYHLTSLLIHAERGVVLFCLLTIVKACSVALSAHLAAPNQSGSWFCGALLCSP